MAEFTDEDDALLEELGVEVEPKAVGGRTAREERIIAAFEEIQRFVAQYRRVPQNRESREIFERLYDWIDCSSSLIIGDSPLADAESSGQEAVAALLRGQGAVFVRGTDEQRERASREIVSEHLERRNSS